MPSSAVERQDGDKARKIIDDFDVVRDAGGAAVRRAISEYSSMDEWLVAAVRKFIEFD